jgi:hypothetical protein
MCARVLAYAGNNSGHDCPPFPLDGLRVKQGNSSAWKIIAALTHTFLPRVAI